MLPVSELSVRQSYLTVMGKRADPIPTRLHGTQGYFGLHPEARMSLELRPMPRYLKAAEIKRRFEAAAA